MRPTISGNVADLPLREMSGEMTSEKRLQWWSSPRTILRTILTLDDTPHSVALGTAIGMFIGMTPTVGIQMILVMVAAYLTRPFFSFNRVAALVTVYLSNPLSVVPIYWFDYKVGTWFIAGTATREDFEKILHYDGLAGWWNALCALFVDVGAPLIVGSLIVATVSGCATYPLMRYLRSNERRRPTLQAGDESE